MVLRVSLSKPSLIKTTTVHEIANMRYVAAAESSSVDAGTSQWMMLTQERDGVEVHSRS